MKPILLTATSMGITLLLTVSGYAKNETTDSFSNRNKILKMLTHNSGISLKDIESCSGFSSTLKEKITLGHFLAWNLSTFEPGKTNEISVKCQEQLTPPECAVDFKSHSASDEDPWSCGLKFNLKKDGALDPKSIKCTGPC